MSFVRNMLNLMLGDSATPESERPSTVVPRFCNWLPYRSFDPKTNIFYNAGSRGFVVEATPMVGASERTGEIMTQFLSEAVPAPGSLEFHSWQASPQALYAEQRFSGHNVNIGVRQRREGTGRGFRG